MFNSNQQGSVNDTRGWEISPARACHLSDHPCPLGEFIGMPFFGSQGLGFRVFWRVNPKCIIVESLIVLINSYCQKLESPF